MFYCIAFVHISFFFFFSFSLNGVAIHETRDYIFNQIKGKNCDKALLRFYNNVCFPCSHTAVLTDPLSTSGLANARKVLNNRNGEQLQYKCMVCNVKHSFAKHAHAHTQITQDCFVVVVFFQNIRHKPKVTPPPSCDVYQFQCARSGSDIISDSLRHKYLTSETANGNEL